jgi:uncharacterized RDD family membrane protein YckC
MTDAMGTEPPGAPEPSAQGGPPAAPAYGMPTTPPPPPPGAWGVAPPTGYGAPSGPPIYEPAGEPLADWGWRTLGWLIDWAILIVPGVLINVIFNSITIGRITFTSTNHTTHVTTTTHFNVLIFVAQALVTALYAGFMIAARGQTLGMMALRLRCVQVDGSPVGFGRAFWRGIFEYVLFMCFILPWLLDVLFPLWDQKKQTLHDKVASTVVVRPRLVPTY